MSVLVNENTRLICQGFTGSQGRRNRTLCGILALAMVTNLSGGANAETTSTINIGSNPVQTVTALAALDGICGSSLPDFATAGKKAKKLGLETNGPQFTHNDILNNEYLNVWSTIDALSATVQIYPDGRKSCVVYFSSNESISQYRASLSSHLDLDVLKKTNAWPSYRGTNATFQAATEARRYSGRLKLNVGLFLNN